MTELQEGSAGRDRRDQGECRREQRTELDTGLKSAKKEIGSPDSRHRAPAEEADGPDRRRPTSTWQARTQPVVSEGEDDHREPIARLKSISRSLPERRAGTTCAARASTRRRGGRYPRPALLCRHPGERADTGSRQPRSRRRTQADRRDASTSLSRSSFTSC